MIDSQQVFDVRKYSPNSKSNPNYKIINSVASDFNPSPALWRSLAKGYDFAVFSIDTHAFFGLMRGNPKKSAKIKIYFQNGYHSSVELQLDNNDNWSAKCF